MMKAAIRIRQFNEEVFYVEDSIIKVERKDIDFLKERALNSQRQRARLCTHKDVDDNIHEMLIVHTKGTYVRPHKHLGKIESFHIIEGLVDVILFDEHGQIYQIIEMGDYQSKLKFYYRISEPLFHTILVRSDIVVFHEITNGPFVRANTIFSDWSPDENDSSLCQRYLNGLTKIADEKKGGL